MNDSLSPRRGLGRLAQGNALGTQVTRETNLAPIAAVLMFGATIAIGAGAWQLQRALQPKVTWDQVQEPMISSECCGPIVIRSRSELIASPLIESSLAELPDEEPGDA